MRPARSFGGPSISMRSVATKMAIAIVVVSLVFALSPEGVRLLFPLIPELVLGRLFVWQPLSYVFLAMDPLGVIFGALIVWSIGSSLEMTWGPRRLFTFGLGTTVMAGVLTVALALALPALRGIPHPGATVLGSALWVAYGLSYGRSQTNFWGMPVSGNMFALFGVGFVVLNGAFGGFARVVPEIFALLMTFLYVRGFSPRILWLRFQNWRLQRAMRGRAKHLKLVGKERNTPSDSDHYLH